MGGDYYEERVLWAGILHTLMKLKCYISRTSCFSVMIVSVWLLEHAHRQKVSATHAACSVAAYSSA